MRGLTVRQPWAWAIVHGGKDVENRTRSLGPYRGPVAIHAGLAIDAAAWESPRFWPDREDEPIEHSALMRGAVIGVVDLLDVHWDNTGDCCHLPERLVCSDWAMEGNWHLCLRNPRPLATPIPWRGALGLWTVPDELEAAIREQVDLGAVV